MTKTSLIALITAAVALGAASASAQQLRPGAPGPNQAPNQAPKAAAQPEQDDPVPVALTVGALQIAADARLALAAMSIDIAADKMLYTYQFKNNATAALDLAASVAMPTLEASADGSEAWTLPVREAENPVGLTVSVGDAVLPAKAHVTATALGVNRLAELKAAHLPLIPVGKGLAKALAELTPETAASLAQIGLVSPRDPAKPNQPIKAAWSLDVTRAFQVGLPAGATTAVKVAFAPVKAEYTVEKGDEEGLDDLKDDYCLSARTLAGVRARLKSGGAWRVTELVVDADGPSNFIATPAVSLTVQKPRPDAIVSFCGINEKAAAGNIVTGAVPDDNEDGDVRIMIFTPDGK